MLGLLLAFLVRIRYLALVSTALGAFIYIRHGGVVAEQNKQNKIAIKGVEIHEEISKNVMSLSDDELDKRLRRWNRD